MFIKSSFLVLRRFRFSICDLRDVGWKQRNKMVIDFVQASELSRLIFGFGLPFMPRLSCSFLKCIIFSNGIHSGMFICPFSLFVFLGYDPLPFVIKLRIPARMCLHPTKAYYLYPSSHIRFGRGAGCCMQKMMVRVGGGT
jgi:hypothetical protein